MTRWSGSFVSCPKTRSISRTPFTGTIHFVWSFVNSPSLRPIPAAKMIACMSYCFRRLSYLTVVLGLFLAMDTLYLHAELIREKGIENDTHEGRECQS